MKLEHKFFDDRAKKLEHFKRLSDIRQIAKTARDFAEGKKYLDEKVHYGALVLAGHITIVKGPLRDAQYLFEQALAFMAKHEYKIPHVEFFRERALKGLETIVYKVCGMPAEQACGYYTDVAEDAFRCLIKYGTEMQEKKLQ